MLGGSVVGSSRTAEPPDVLLIVTGGQGYGALGDHGNLMRTRLSVITESEQAALGKSGRFAEE